MLKVQCPLPVATLLWWWSCGGSASRWDDEDEGDDDDEGEEEDLFVCARNFIDRLLINSSPRIFLDARSCVTCDKVLAGLEQIDDDTDSFGVDFVKINDKRLAKQYGIKSFPALTYFR